MYLLVPPWPGILYSAQSKPNLPEQEQDCRLGLTVSAQSSGLQAQPTYLCPLISATSVMPPTLKRKYSRPRARAMERAMLVLPTPGGPWKQRILPCVEPRSWLTAMNSCGSQDGSVHSMQTPKAKTKGLIVHQLQRVSKAGLNGAVAAGPWAEVGQARVGGVNHVRGPSSTPSTPVHWDHFEFQWIADWFSAGRNKDKMGQPALGSVVVHMLWVSPGHASSRPPCHSGPPPAQPGPEPSPSSHHSAGPMEWTSASPGSCE